MPSPQQSMIVDSFNSQTYVPNQMDVQNAPIYDTVQYSASNSTTAPLVGNVINPLTSALFTSVGPSSGKTYAQTNMQQSRLLPSPQAFSIFGFRFRFSENISVLDLWNVFNGFAYEFWIGEKCYSRAPLWFYNAGGGIYGFTTTTATSVFNNGMPGRTDMHKLGITIVIENQTTFYALLNGTAYTINSGGTGVLIQSLLDGMYAKGVQ